MTIEKLSGSRRSRGATRRLLVSIGATFAIAMAGTVAKAEQELVVFKGTGAKLTPEFEVKGPWLLDWSAGGTMSSVLGIEIALLEGDLLQHKGLVIATHRPGSGTKLFTEGGRYRFRVDSSFVEWRLRVSKITPEEAASMIPTR